MVKPYWVPIPVLLATLRLSRYHVLTFLLAHPVKSPSLLDHIPELGLIYVNPGLVDLAAAALDHLEDFQYRPTPGDYLTDSCFRGPVPGSLLPSFIRRHENLERFQLYSLSTSQRTGQRRPQPCRPHRTVDFAGARFG